jgi:hypothetical protein
VSVSVLGLVEFKGSFKAKAVNEVDAGRDRVEEDS